MGEPFVEKEFAPIVQAQRDANCARGFPSVRKEGVRDARVAIVGYGPSLTDTHSLIAKREFDAVWTVSKAHDFLLERGLVPTHHTDTDYREHKARYNQRFDPRVRYLMATQVHPTYLDRLVGKNVALFHNVLPVGTYDARYFKLPTMFDAALTAARLAFELGYRQQEWFGLDACITPDATHAGPHEGWQIIDPAGEQLAPVQVEAGGQRWLSNAFLLRQAVFAERMLRTVPRMKVTIHGGGMLRPFLLERRRVVVF